MRHRQTGLITNNLWYLGREESGVYLLEGRDSSIIISGGMSYLVPDILTQFATYGIDEKKIRKLIILHAHFDHVGIVPFFKRRQPDMEVYASGRAWEILQMPEAVQTINVFSNLVAQKMGIMNMHAAFDVEWRSDVSGITVGEGDRIDLGGVSLSVTETPGHSSCSISVYSPELKALFPSDASGVPYKDAIMPSGNSNFTKFQRSLEKLEIFDVDYMCADHYGYITGNEARNFTTETIKEAALLRSKIESSYLRTNNVDATVKELLTETYSRYPDYFLAPEIMEGVFGQMVKHITGMK